MTTDLQEKKTKDCKKKRGCTCCTVGCGAPFLVFFVSFCFYIAYVEFGENKDTSPIYYTEKGSDYSYHFSYINRYGEFTIAEQDFLDWCGKQTDWCEKDTSWQPVEIESLPSLPRDDRFPGELHESEFPRINLRRDLHLWIVRYCFSKLAHKDCSSHRGKCRIDPTGKTNDSCFRIVDDGYYFESRHSTGGGVYILYDREDNRCYIQWASH